MKKATVFLILCVFCYVFTVHGQTRATVASSLKMQKLVKSYTEKKCYTFLNEFPTDFNGMTALYGYNDASPDYNIYKYYQEHINFLFNCNKNVNSIFVNKLVLLSIGGKWESDAVSLFQNNERILLLHDINIFSFVLNKKNVSQQKRFWHFIFDGSPPHDKQIKELYDRVYRLLIKNAPEQAKIAKQEFYKMYH